MNLAQKIPAFGLILAIGVSAFPTTALAVKKCTNTYSNGQRCTTCTYSNYPEHISVNCIAWKTPTNNSGQNNSFGTLKRLKALKG